MPFKTPRSVLVVIHTSDGMVLLLERARHPGYWQSVTGSIEGDESDIAAAIREVAEETGLSASGETLQDWRIENRFEILPLWRDRYAPGVTHNIERSFSLAVPSCSPPTLAAAEHRAFAWTHWADAVDRVFSWTNRDAIVRLALTRGWLPPR